MNITINWQCDGKWLPFDLNDLLHMSRTHCINLFSGKVIVVAKEDGVYITNDPKLEKQYKKNKQSVKMFKDLQPSERTLDQVGFLQAAV